MLAKSIYKREFTIWGIRSAETIPRSLGVFALVSLQFSQFRVTPCRKLLLVNFVLLANFAGCRFQGRWKDWWIIGAKFFSLGIFEWAVDAISSFSRRSISSCIEGVAISPKIRCETKNQKSEQPGTAIHGERVKVSKREGEERGRGVYLTACGKSNNSGGIEPPLLPLELPGPQSLFVLFFFFFFFSFLLLLSHAQAKNNSNFQSTFSARGSDKCSILIQEIRMMQSEKVRRLESEGDPYGGDP